MSVDDREKTDSSANSSRTEEKNSSVDMASVLQGLQSSLTQLVKVSKAQTEAFNSLREDILLQPDPDEEVEEGVLDKTSNSLDLQAAAHKSIARLEQRPKSFPHSDSESKNDLLDSLTQALLSTSKKFPDIEGKLPHLSTIF